MYIHQLIRLAHVLCANMRGVVYDLHRIHLECVKTSCFLLESCDVAHLDIQSVVDMRTKL